MLPPDTATIQVLRSDLALQLARFVAHGGKTQVDVARDLGIPQPTLSKIVNARVADLSLELLIRIAVRAGLPIVLQTGRQPAEAGVHVSGAPAPYRKQVSRLADRARDDLAAGEQPLTPEQRLNAQLKHSELMAALRQSGKEYRTSAPARHTLRPR